jgi:hypothetical protein
MANAKEELKVALICFTPPYGKSASEKQMR